MEFIELYDGSRKNVHKGQVFFYFSFKVYNKMALREILIQTKIDTLMHIDFREYYVYYSSNGIKLYTFV